MTDTVTHHGAGYGYGYGYGRDNNHLMERRFLLSDGKAYPSSHGTNPS
ncbi:hypothetical protein [Streptomyces sp. NPDC001315]